jgi:stearoyl-CoA desaturase (delta-9 desaturase)
MKPLNTDRISIISVLPLLLMHTVTTVLVCYSTVSWFAVSFGVFMYYARMFGISAGFHRYFAHRSYKTSRVFQFIMAFLATSATQRGPLWWASLHRVHHKHSDDLEDVHSPIHRGFWWSHIGWLFVKAYNSPSTENMKDFYKYPEIKWLDRFHYVPPIILGFATYILGSILELKAPSLHTSGFELLTWGYFVSTVVLYHGTFTVNSLCHLFGSRPHNTGDYSRNNGWIALITMGEGWHNNHHYYQSSERQGMYWWQIDGSHYVLKFLSFFRIVWDLRTFPKKTAPVDTMEESVALPAPAPAIEPQATV